VARQARVTFKGGIKMKKRIASITIFILCITIALSAAGCASFPGKELPMYTYEQISLPEKKITATFDVKASGHGLFQKDVSYIEKEVQKILTQSQLYAQLTPNKNDGEHHYSFNFKNTVDNRGIATATWLLSGATLFILPGYTRDNFILSVDVKQGDKVLKTYTYQEHVTTWGEILLVFASLTHWPPNISQSVIDNMLMNFVHDYSQDIKSGVYLTQTQ
jgi:hypothetical protein